jgi:hypothetical protein
MVSALATPDIAIENAKIAGRLIIRETIDDSRKDKITAGDEPPAACAGYRS